MNPKIIISIHPKRHNPRPIKIEAPTRHNIYTELPIIRRTNNNSRINNPKNSTTHNNNITINIKNIILNNHNIINNNIPKNIPRNKKINIWNIGNRRTIRQEIYHPNFDIDIRNFWGFYDREINIKNKPIRSRRDRHIWTTAKCRYIILPTNSMPSRITKKLQYENQYKEYHYSSIVHHFWAPKIKQH
ncbi:MAG: hypothetical protein DRI92_01680 [Aquificota bacterium]|nr:MAG: hypothetical protein DRI92_01680 [Aquificota bacterium]